MEAGGIEPPSKVGELLASTSVVRPWFSLRGKPTDEQPHSQPCCFRRGTLRLRVPRLAGFDDAPTRPYRLGAAERLRIFRQRRRTEFPHLLFVPLFYEDHTAPRLATKRRPDSVEASRPQVIHRVPDSRFGKP